MVRLEFIANGVEREARATLTRAAAGRDSRDARIIRVVRLYSADGSHPTALAEIRDIDETFGEHDRPSLNRLHRLITARTRDDCWLLIVPHHDVAPVPVTIAVLNCVGT
jgi:hypothetical protein